MKFANAKANMINYNAIPENFLTNMLLKMEIIQYLLFIIINIGKEFLETLILIPMMINGS